MTSEAENYQHVESTKSLATTMSKASVRSTTNQLEKSKSEIGKALANCCKKKKKKRDVNTTIIYEYPPECDPPKFDRTPRHCMTRKEHLNFLAKPHIKCNATCEKQAVCRVVRPTSALTNELAKPQTRKLIIVREEYAGTLSTKMLCNLNKLIDPKAICFDDQSKPMIDNFNRGRRRRRSKKCKLPITCSAKLKKKCKNKKKKKNKKSVGCDGGGESGEPTPCGTALEREVKKCQQNLALLFIRNMLCHECKVPEKDYRDIADLLLGKLSDLANYKPAEPDDCKTQQMRFLSDSLACWIAGIMNEIHEQRLANQEEEEVEEEEIKEEIKKEKDDDDDEGTVCKESCSNEESVLPSAQDSISGMVIGTGAGTEAQSSVNMSGFCHCSEKIDEKPEEEIIVKEEPKIETSDVEQQTEQKEYESKEIMTDEIKSDKEQCQLEAISSRMAASLNTKEMPLVTFAKILDALYAMIECDTENKLCNPMVNQLHEAIYKKLEPALLEESCNEGDQKVFKERTKDVLDVVSGKLALWLMRIMDEKQLNVLRETKPKVESRVIREKVQRSTKFVDMAMDWMKSFDELIEDIKRMKKQPITQQDLQKWKNKVDKNILLFRRDYLEAKHEDHHDKMMLTGREVIKTNADGQFVKTVNFS